jgi:periplasmic protein CpxP/Spy
MLRTYALLLLLLSTLTVAPAQAHAHRRIAQGVTDNGVLKIPAQQMGKLTKELNLSNDQVQRIQKIRQDSEAKLKERRQALKTAKQELSQLVAGSGSSDRIRQQRKQVQSLRQEVEDMRFENGLAIREILTPEQRVKLQQIVQSRKPNSGKLR